MEIEFKAFPKIPRLNRHCVVTEKLDGSNSQIIITEGGQIAAGSRNRLITPGKATDNFGFAGWVQDNKEELLKLGPGHHYGEWWGKGIQRGYGLTERRFSLFNVSRWANHEERPACVGTVPLVYVGAFSSETVNGLVDDLREKGSLAVPGFKAEGVIVYLAAAQQLFKVLCENDAEAKGQGVPEVRLAA